MVSGLPKILTVSSDDTQPVEGQTIPDLPTATLEAPTFTERAFVITQYEIKPSFEVVLPSPMAEVGIAIEDAKDLFMKCTKQENTQECLDNYEYLDITCKEQAILPEDFEEKREIFLCKELSPSPFTDQPNQLRFGLQFEPPEDPTLGLGDLVANTPLSPTKFINDKE